MGGRWRWLVVAAIVATLAAIPAIVGALPVHVPTVALPELRRRILASADQPYQGYAVVSGDLSLPDVPVFHDLSTLLSETTHFRAWVAGPDRWRVDQLGAFGETDTYVRGDRSLTWESERHRVTERPVHTGLRVPRGQDLLPPELGRRLIGAASPSRLSRLSPRRIAGVAAAGLRVSPGSVATTISAVDVWVDPRTGLPVDVEVFAKGLGHPALSSKFLDLSQSRPSHDAVTFSPAKDAVATREPWGGDPVGALRQFWSTALPVTLGPLPRRSGPGVVATYGTGYTIVVVADVPSPLVADRDSPLAKLPTVRTVVGPAPAFSTPLLNGLAVQIGDQGYVLAGPVRMSQLRMLVAALAAEVAVS